MSIKDLLNSFTGGQLLLSEFNGYAGAGYGRLSHKEEDKIQRKFNARLVQRAYQLALIPLLWFKLMNPRVLA